MSAIGAETRSELITKLNRIRAELEHLAKDGKTEENCDEARVLEEQADEVLDVLDAEEADRILNDLATEWIPIEEVARELGLS